MQGTLADHLDAFLLQKKLVVLENYVLLATQAQAKVADKGAQACARGTISHAHHSITQIITCSSQIR